MRVAVTGASGLIGSALVAHLREKGHDVVRFVRRAPSGPGEAIWDSESGNTDVEALASADAVVNLSGAPVGFPHRWTKSYKQVIYSSRVDVTRSLSDAMSSMATPPPVFISSSAIGFYGSTGDTEVDEAGPKGDGFLADLVVDWEAAADPAREAGVRVAHPRTGLVIAGRGGAWGYLWPIFQMGVGGKLSRGDQWWSFISLRDEVRALEHLLVGGIEGPVNLTAPNPATNAQVTSAMGSLLHRPTLLHVPRPALEIGLGGFATEVLDTARVVPRVLLDSGFEFRDPTLDDALAWGWSQRSKR